MGCGCLSCTLCTFVVVTCLKAVVVTCLKAVLTTSWTRILAFLQAGMKAREQALFAALDDMESWLATGVVTEPDHSGCRHLHTSFLLCYWLLKLCCCPGT